MNVKVLEGGEYGANLLPRAQLLRVRYSGRGTLLRVCKGSLKVCEDPAGWIGMSELASRETSKACVNAHHVSLAVENRCAAGMFWYCVALFVAEHEAARVFSTHTHTRPYASVTGR